LGTDYFATAFLTGALATAFRGATAADFLAGADLLTAALGFGERALP
jgi:hypothetical protein